tara:strand:+ start:1013 stop:1312 length:300 start_codon:yes stop_codon:yes gene_type:complete
MPYPNEPTVHESLQQFFTFYENYSTREDVEEAIALGNIDGDHSYFKDVAAFETVKKFIEDAYELAFGDDAINRDWHPDAVIEELKSFSDKALAYDEGEC